ncbi:uncharacterized protein MONOS_11968 [Monocercomonoides exilis]|uniref:uncharacterized protein n=1 Tax=Monocercomonoides exilis TaxID=2049356 RepID=UPI003559AB8E|nr:hypothetical protein MONOS_11968 [Monocercomonoides exilis]|eukprot:MONOS_11968.1-p1 / transcript=MONOS_11968.1 / gene=MONOS_11968 / organism=Monocercomonoides_exilis_PA203 / gene_product=unspecified product / transcript_product=unspecified product / location=Mono_scaffold00631:29453-30775(+) / protein_length=440 / sequence_SO=supercontig / SO=protein_coding / is_pseudo=false
MSSTISKVGLKFSEKYYQTLEQNPAELSRLYETNAVVVIEDESTSKVMDGEAQIEAGFSTMQARHADVRFVKSTGFGNQVLISIDGSMNLVSNPDVVNNFTHAFVLQQRPDDRKRFFVIREILHIFPVVVKKIQVSAPAQTQASGIEQSQSTSGESQPHTSSPSPTSGKPFIAPQYIRTPSVARSIHVSLLERNNAQLTQQDLLSALKEFGRVLCIDVIESKKVAVVEFAEELEALNAVKNCERVRVNGERVIIRMKKDAATSYPQIPSHISGAPSAGSSSPAAASSSASPSNSSTSGITSPTVYAPLLSSSAASTNSTTYSSKASPMAYNPSRKPYASQEPALLPIPTSQNTSSPSATPSTSAASASSPTSYSSPAASASASASSSPSTSSPVTSQPIAGAVVGGRAVPPAGSSVPSRGGRGGGGWRGRGWRGGRGGRW